MSGQPSKEANKHPPTHGWSQYESMRKVEEAEARRPVAEPYTVPEGYKAPSMKELWQYAQRRHPYAQYGYGLVFLVGLAAYAGITMSRVDRAHQASKEAKRA